MIVAQRSPLTVQALAAEKVRYRGSTGCSAGNRSLGFRPAFLDRRTGRVHPSAFADGRPAPVHLLDGLPECLVMARDARGRASELHASVVSGFARDGRFYTREQAMQACEEEAFGLTEPGFPGAGAGRQ